MGGGLDKQDEGGIWDGGVGVNRVTVLTPKVVSERLKISATKQPAKVVSFPVRVALRKAA